MLVKCISGCLPVNKDCVASEAEWAVRVKEWDDPGVRPEVWSLHFPFLSVCWSKCQLPSFSFVIRKTEVISFYIGVVER